jgi:choline dehydrogenase-like flavoprotein
MASFSSVVDAGWSYDDVLPYFQRAERRVGSNACGVYGTSGPQFISELREPNPTTSAFLAGCAEQGRARSMMRGDVRREHAQTAFHPVGTCRMGSGITEASTIRNRLRPRTRSSQYPASYRLWRGNP